MPPSPETMPPHLGALHKEIEAALAKGAAPLEASAVVNGG
jgi:hypothetical protein